MLLFLLLLLSSLAPPTLASRGGDFFAAHGVRGIFEEGPGMGPGDGTDMEELKDYGKTDRQTQQP